MGSHFYMLGFEETILSFFDTDKMPVVDIGYVKE